LLPVCSPAPVGERAPDRLAATRSTCIRDRDRGADQTQIRGAARKSRGGRVWSYLVASSLERWVDWCDGVGTKLIDDAINIDA
jgi:hypothetical protein